MKHPSLYLDWYVHVPSIRYDLRSSGISAFKYALSLGEVDLSANYAHGNPDATEQLAKWYGLRPGNVFVSSEGASGQNARIIRYLAEKNSKKSEAIVEYPTYEPLLRQVQEHFKKVERLQRSEKDAYKLDADALRKLVSKKTGLLVLTNPHAPSGAISETSELREIMSVAREHGFYVLSDEIYAEFDRKAVPTLFSIDQDQAVVTTSFTKAYGLGGIKLGVALAEEQLVDEFYLDVLNTVGNTPNIVQIIAAELLLRGEERLTSHKQRWIPLKKVTEEWLEEQNLEYFPSEVGVTYWVKLPIRDTHRWMNKCAIPDHNLAAVPGAFFLFKNNYELENSNMIRLGLGNINSDAPDLSAALEILARAFQNRL